MRVTSDTMIAHLKKAPVQTLTDIYTNSPSGNLNRELIVRLMELSPKVESCFRDLEIGEALDSVMGVLKLVRAICLIPTSYKHIFFRLIEL